MAKQGFELDFTAPFSVSKKGDISSLVTVKKYKYHYHEKYGSPRINEENVAIKGVKTAAENSKMTLNIGKLEAGFVYEIKIDSMLSKGLQDTLTNKVIAYTVKKTKD